jgi:ParB family transcriptional regulator, chromosome partitioning protein
VSKRIGLPVTLKMRHDAHYVESLTTFSGASVGRMLPIESVRPDPEQPRKTLGDVGELAESIREKGVLEPLLVRYVAREDVYYIISGERRYHAAREAGLRELPCIEKNTDDAETLEISLIENLQRKDLTPFEEADGLARLAEQFEYTHEEIARKIGKSRTSVTELLSLCVIPGAVRRQCMESGVTTKSLLLQIARQPTPSKMNELVGRISQGKMTRDEARRIRRQEQGTAPRPEPFIFSYRADDDSFVLRLQFRRHQVSREEVVAALHDALAAIERSSERSTAAETSLPAA